MIRYVNEPGSPWVQALCAPEANHTLVLAQIGLVEIAADLGSKYRQGLLDETIRDALLRDLYGDGQNQYWLVETDEVIVKQAIELTRRHKLRGYDAVHLSSALFLRTLLSQHNMSEPVFLCADQELIAAAQVEGFTVDDPNLYFTP